MVGVLIGVFRSVIVGVLLVGILVFVAFVTIQFLVLLGNLFGFDTKGLERTRDSFVEKVKKSVKKLKFWKG